MYKKLQANTIAKKIFVFAVVFALTGVLMGSTMVGMTDPVLYQPVFAAAPEQIQFGGSDDDPGPDAGEFTDFMALVQGANGTSDSDGFVLLEQQLGQAQFCYLPDIPLSYELQEYTFQRCQELGLEYEMVLALMWRESRFDITAVGYNANGTRDNGVMQINDINRGWLREQYGITDLMDPYQNIDAGTLILAQFYSAYGDDNTALMAYHLGEAGMRRKMAQGVTTNKQVRIAMEKRDDFVVMLGQA